MVLPPVGAVVLVRFPFSDLSHAFVRPTPGFSRGASSSARPDGSIALLGSTSTRLSWMVLGPFD